MANTIIPVRSKGKRPVKKAPVLGKPSTAPRPTSTNPASRPSSRPSTSRTSKSKSSKSSAKNSVASAQRRAEKQQKERDDRTGKRYLKQAKNLDSQASALKKALGEMKERRKQDIQDITRTRDTQLADLTSSAAELGKTYTVAGENNEAATAATQESGMANLVRERQDALGQILTQGAGESDTIKAMLIAARNQNANAAEGNRAFYDTLASINQGVVGLNEDTKTKLSNAWIAGEGEKEQIWRDYLEARGEALTQLGQVRTAQADAYANAEEYEAKIPRLGKNKKAKKKLKNTKGSGTGFSKAASLSSSNKLIGISGTGKKMRKGKPGTPADKLRRRQAGNAFDDWAELQDESYEQKEAPDWIKNYRGMDQLKGAQSNSNLAAAVTIEKGGRAEGASLRKW